MSDAIAAAVPGPRGPQQPLFLPKLVSCLRTYSMPLFWGDLTSGVIVGIVALPLAIAFAIASGVTPERGLATAIIAGFLISALGGSRVQIGGPTGAFVVIVYQIVQQYGTDGLLVCTLLAGAMLLLMGLLRLGTVIKFIPYPLTVGFTAGIAVVILSSQLRDVFGLHTGLLPAQTLHQWARYVEVWRTGSLPTTALSLLSLLILIGWPRMSRRIPGSIVAIIVVTVLVHALQLPVETIGSRFGDLPAGLPRPAWPSMSVEQCRHLLGPAFTVALLGAIESLLSATVADGMIEGRHRSNTELIAQGIANLTAPLFGGIPATGAIARTATNVRNGGRTPVAGIIHSITLLLLMLLFGHWARLIPLCVLAAILMTVAFHMSEWHAFRALLRAPRMDIAVLMSTFLLTIVIDLTVAVEIGLMLSVFLFMKRMTDVTTIRQVTQEMSESLDEQALRQRTDSVSRRHIPQGVSVFEAEGAFFFGVAELLRDTLDVGQQRPRVVILRMRHVLALDASGLRALRDLRARCAGMGTVLVIEGIHAQPLVAMDRAGLLGEFGEQNIVATLDAALQRAGEVLLGSPASRK